jgi:hypothetical protein
MYYSHKNKTTPTPEKTHKHLAFLKKKPKTEKDRNILLTTSF